MSNLPVRPTLIETGDGHVIVVNVADGRVRVEWQGSPRAELTAGEARSLGYVLRGYASMIEPAGDPGQ